MMHDFGGFTVERIVTGTWKENLRDRSIDLGLDPDLIGNQTDPEELAEGLYIKREDEHQVLGRYKFIRASFLSAVLESESHWLDRPIVRNRLAENVDIFDPGSRR